MFKGAECLHPDDRRCLISLSDGGEDAVTVREFDLATGTFVEGGFALPRAKHRVAWEDADHLLVASEWTPGDLTSSGYPYIVKRLTRGQPPSAAVEIFRGTKDDVAASASTYVDAQGRHLAVVERALDFFHTETFVVTPKGTRRLAIPAKASVSDLLAGRIIVKTDEAWEAGGTTIPAGSLAHLDLAAVMADPVKLHPVLMMAPGPRDSIEGSQSTRDRLIVATLDNVRGRAWALTPHGKGWTKTRLDLPDNLAANSRAANTCCWRSLPCAISSPALPCVSIT